MIFKEISIFHKNYNMINEFSSSINHTSRDSWIIQIIDSDNIIGYGEASPIHGFNDESNLTVYLLLNL